MAYIDMIAALSVPSVYSTLPVGFCIMSSSWPFSCVFVAFILPAYAVYPIHSDFLPTNIIPSSYSDLCSSIVPQSTPTHPTSRYSLPHYFTTSYVTGGQQLFGRPNHTIYYGQHSFSLRIQQNCYETITQGVYLIWASLKLGEIDFLFTGFWSEILRETCMVGSTYMISMEGQAVNVTGVLKMKYESDQNPTIRNAVVSGTLESTSSKKNPGYFDPVSVFGFRDHPDYKYSLVGEEIQSFDDSRLPKGSSLSLEPGQFCSHVLSMTGNYFEMEYSTECNESWDKDCSPTGSGDIPRPGFINLVQVHCLEDERKTRYIARFLNAGDGGYAPNQEFSFESAMIAEGAWDDKSNQLSVVACRILDPVYHFGDAVGDCGIRLSLRYPSVWTIIDNARVVGQLWSTGNGGDDKGYFRRINLTSNGLNDGVQIERQRYEYTEMEKVHKLCPLKRVKKGETYPDAKSYDMAFHTYIQTPLGEIMHAAFVMPLFLENELWQNVRVDWGPTSKPVLPSISKSENGARVPVVNISYTIDIGPYFKFNSSQLIPTLNMSFNHHHEVMISAEGIYYGETGQLCMVGCRKLFKNNVSRDCDILVKFDFAPLSTSKGNHINGTIASIRPEGDPLRFDDVNLFVGRLYTKPAEEYVWFMDMEMTLFLISYMLYYMLVGLDILHAIRNPKAITLMSVMVILILVVMPLVLNDKVVGGWLDKNEAVVGVIAMVALLLQIRHLQLFWAAKQTKGCEKRSWSGKQKASSVIMLLYTLVILFTFMVNWTRNLYGSSAN